MKIILARLKEPSTWAGISGLLLANALIMGDQYQPILGACAIITGVVAVLLRDPGHDPD
jgi:hypothetical protein